ncbi:LpqB family beta-propeller domain-containing protein [Melissospora conviva]|uniref:LpqB family beta-propeller domain-containing protein n=1 Tax=Melissospora conviva TaxID=3388432 RepID=UPI003C1B0070
MNRALRVLLAALLAGLLPVAGCGIPSETDVQVDGPGPSVEADSGAGRAEEPPDRRSAGTDPETFVHNYLAAAAGETDLAYQRVKQFIVPANRDQLQEKQGSEVAINVVRLLEPPTATTNDDGTIRVAVRVQQIGVLRSTGVLSPATATESRYVFRLGRVSDVDVDEPGLFLLDAPKVLLLSDVALRDYYQPHTIYFWNTQQSALVPDQRYLPVVVARERRATEVVKWLVAGPAEWLTVAAARLPDGTELIGTVPETGGRLEINLSTKFDDQTRLDRLATQLAWSLPPSSGELEIKIRNQSKKVVNVKDHRAGNAIYQVTGPDRFCIYDGSVYPLPSTLGMEPGAVPTVPMTSEVNRDVASAGFGTSGPRALVALVRATPDGQQLFVGTGAPLVEKVTAVGPVFRAMSRPVWLKSAGQQPVGLVVAGPGLYSFGAGGRMTQVDLTVSGRVTAASASLDGHRLAFVVDGALYLAALAVDGETVIAGPARRVPSRLGRVTAVDWSQENSLIVAGSAGRSVINEISVDGGTETSVKDAVGETPVSHLAAYPTNPLLPAGTGRVMYETNGVAWAGLPGVFAPIQIEDVAGVTAPTGLDAPNNPTAPFYRY